MARSKPPRNEQRADRTDRFSHPKLTVARVVEAIKLTGGIMSEVARMLGVSRQTVYNYRDQHQEVQDAIIEEREHTLDLAEATLKNLAIVEKKERSLIFLLESLGKDRGYVKRLESVGKDGGPIAVDANVTQEFTDEQLRDLAPEELDALIAAEKVKENVRKRNAQPAGADGASAPVAARKGGGGE